MPNAVINRDWGWLANNYACQSCGAPGEHIHHINHILHQRISKDDWLVVRLCAGCHQHGETAVHRLGGERQFLEATGIDLVQLAAMNRHKFEVKEL